MVKKIKKTDIVWKVKIDELGEKIISEVLSFFQYMLPKWEKEWDSLHFSGKFIWDDDKDDDFFYLCIEGERLETDTEYKKRLEKINEYKKELEKLKKNKAKNEYRKYLRLKKKFEEVKE